MRTWNMIVGFGCFAGMSLGLAACGGFSNLGEGVGGEGGEGAEPATMTGGSAGKGMGTGGTMNPGSGGTMNPGAGGTMNPGSGGTMNPGTGGMNPGTGGTMNPGTGGSMGTPTPSFGCDGLACGSMCLGIETLMDGSGTTFSGTCGLSGVCQRGPAECSPRITCMATSDCLERVDPQCIMCNDGSTACAEFECLMGECVASAPAVCATECTNAECGTPCSLPAVEMGMGDGTDAAIYATCNAAGQCQAGQAECGGAACMANADCANFLLCQDCGNGFCSTNLCIEGRCSAVCPMPLGGSCENDMDCPPPPPICQSCGDDTCAGTTCVEGQCVFGCL